MSDTYNPILTKEELGRWRIFQQRPVPEPGTALVFFGEGQTLVSIIQGQKGLTGGEMFWGKYNLLYKVDMSEHPLSFRCDLPCKTDAFDFHAEVKFNCLVHDPEMIVRRNVTDVRKILEPLIIEVMRNMSREYEVEQSGIAEREIGDRVKKEVYDVGFQLNRFTLTLSLEQETRDRIREKKRIQETTELEKINIQGMLELEKEKQKLAMQREQFEIERMKLKIDFYGPIIQAGNWQLLTMQLIQRPEDVAVIAEAINQQKQIERDHQIKMLKMLLDADALEGSQIGEVGKRLLQGLIGLTEQSTPALESRILNNSESLKVSEIEKTDNGTSSSEVPEEFRR
ncbi:hypothetical protein ACE1CI_01530 [Aerosakkonemataceae cyanobacterium BLCC-F50]|uniref:Band 7 domain-containing protein n=1 Tax=Floridaenema flaviceps BLCC-F50 TaxID=3153642 RepID=A0ABV4XKH9_9CYAN